jgi:hypothetical protein
MPGCKIEDKTVWQQDRAECEELPTQYNNCSLNPATASLNGLNDLLSTIQPINFFNYFADKNIVEPKQKHYLVAVVENLLNVAKEQKWDLVKQGDFIYFFNGCYWQNISREEVKRFLMHVAIKQG